MSKGTAFFGACVLTAYVAGVAVGVSEVAHLLLESSLVAHMLTGITVGWASVFIMFV